MAELEHRASASRGIGRTSTREDHEGDVDAEVDVADEGGLD